MSIKVPKLARVPKIDGDWHKYPWRDMEPELLGNYMGEMPDHRPRAEVKIAYDDHALYLIFRVADRYVRAVAKNHQDPVCGDSCVEFFFSPGPDVADGYFNLEVNCGGTMLFHFQKVPRQNPIALPASEYDKVEIGHSLPQLVDPEIETPLSWTVEYRLPLDILASYCYLTRPAPGVTWRANFCKCADNSSHPHWLTWSLLDYPRPNFHLPQFFGLLEFR